MSRPVEMSSSGGLSLNISTVVLALVCMSVLYSAILATYRIYFDPLSKFPGPKIAAATFYYYYYVSISGQLAAKTRLLHEKYGDVVRLSPNHLSFIGETAWKDIYGHKQGRKQLQKVSRPSFASRKKQTYHILNAPDDIHARQRKMISHAFSDRALRDQEPLMKKYIDKMISILHTAAKENKMVDLVKSYNFTAFDFIGDFTFAESFHCLETGNMHPFMVRIFRAARAGVIVQAIVAAIPPIKLVFQFLRQFMDGYNYNTFIHDKVVRRIKDGDRERPDLMSGILRHNTEDGTGITQDEIEATSSILISAGAETTATLLSGCTYFLLQNPGVLKKLQTKLRDTFKTSDDISIAGLNQITYLLAVLEESLRLYPPVAIAFPRVTPREGISICGHYVPGNIVVGVYQYAAYVNSSNFTDSLDFVPERWLEDRPRKYENDRRGIFQPFSYGPRNCVGKNLAYTEMKLFLSRVLYDFDLELSPDSQECLTAQKVWVFWEKTPLFVKLKEKV